MKMKNIVALFATLMIGLLVMAGCEGLFEPPAGLSDGKGTLYVSINDANGRTILPSGRLDNYKITITGAGAPADPILATGSTAIPLAAGTYTVDVEGLAGVDEDGDPIVVASKMGESVTIGANQIATLTVDLEPEATGDGTFSFDFDVNLVETVSVTVYEEDGTTAVTGKTSALKADEIELPAGVYDVAFEVTTGTGPTAKTYKWREILYIYADMTSKYGNDDLVSIGVLPTIPYVVPAAGPGFFYVDLNQWKTSSPGAGGLGEGFEVVPKATTSAGSIAVSFAPARSDGGQRINFNLTALQTEILNTSKGPFKVTIAGSGGDDNNFRYFLGDATMGGSWDAAGVGGPAKFSDLTKEIEIDWRANHASADPKHFILQRMNVATTTITINSIKIEYPIDGSFDLDVALANKTADGTAVVDNNGLAPVSDGVAAFPATSGTRLAFPLTADQVKLLQGVTADPTATPPVEGVPAAETVYITVKGTTTATTDINFRYHLGFLNHNSGWNATQGTAHNDTPFSGLVSANGTTIGLALTPGRLTDPGNTNSGTPDDPSDDLAAVQGAFFILQLRAATATNVTITGINIGYVLEEVAVPDPVCGCATCALKDKTALEAKQQWIFCDCATCTDPVCKDLKDPGMTAFNAIVGLPWGGVAGSSSPVIDSTNNIVTVTASGSSAFWLNLPAFVDGDGDPVTFDPANDALVITYAAVVWPGTGAGHDAKVTLKKGGTGGEFADITAGNNEKYPTLTTTNAGTLNLSKGALEAGATTIGFQHNDDAASNLAKYKVKIISIEIKDEE